MNRKERLAGLNDIDIYPVTCRELSEGRTNLEVLDAVMAGGAKIIQLREKHLDKKDIYLLAVEFRRRTLKHNVLLIINDHLDVAMAVGADGVHLGQDDLPVKAARDVDKNLIIGASSHSLTEALQAEKDGADYVNIGPVFPTKTKKDAGAFIGTDAIREIGPKLSVPFTTMGGITTDNIHQVLEAGARRIAMVTEITRAPDIAKQVQKIQSIIQSYR
jgi:thiamine-phosphate pyrophosphorylase